MNKEIFIPISAMVLIAWLMTVALYKNMNGTLLTASIGVIAGIAGYIVKGVKDKW